MTPEPAGVQSVVVTVMTVTQLLLAAGGGYMYFRWQRTRRQCDELLKEKEVIFGFVHDVGEVFAEAENIAPDLLLKRVLFYALRTTKATAGAIYLQDPQGEQLHARALSGVFPPLSEAVDGRTDPGLSRSRHVENLVRTRAIAKGEGLVGLVAETATPILVAEAERDPRVPKHTLDFLKIHSLLLVPMRFHQQVLGVLVVVNRADGRSFVEEDVNMLQALADQASASVHYVGLRDTLDEKKRIDHDLGVARRIQMALLPERLPHPPGVELAAFNEPAQQIGGDYYDFVTIDDQHLGIAIADVSGKGIGGAMLMSVCRSVLRAQAPGNLSPAAVLKSLNRVMGPDISEDMFVTMIYMVLHLDTHELVLARAGHERPVLISARGEVRHLDAPGLAIGMTDADTFDAALSETRLKLEPGDVVVAYTDGITEAMNGAGQEWGLPELVAACQVASADGAHSVLDNVRTRLRRWVGGRAQYDDMTLLAIRLVR
jgi:sigma-B regulation protein RsbU (phosphoserine phosphatase)